MPTIDYRLKNAPVDIWEKDRWTLLTFLLLHANVRNRCWPSMRWIAKQTHKSMPYLSAAKKWLIAVGAVEIVPYKQRAEDEKKLPRRQHIYQLTGKFSIEGKTYPYLYTTDENGEVETTPNPAKPDVKRRETLTTFTLSISSNDSSESNNTVSASALQPQNPDPKPEPEIITIPVPPPIKVPRKVAPQPSKQVKKSASTSGARAGRKPQRLDPFWNAFADTLYQGARNGNQRLARVMFGQKDHGLFGIIAYECEHQNCQEEKLDYAAMALWVPKFAASLPKDNTGKTIELRDPAKVQERWIGWRESATTRINCPPVIFYDPNCPHRFDVEKCDKGWILKEINGERMNVECECQIKIRKEKGLKW